MLVTTKETSNGRGCGSRKPGAAYACCGTSSNGQPIENFVLDPVVPWPWGWQRGIKILPRNPDDPTSVNDLIIFVGRESYPSPWDFVEEARRFGASRKMPSNLPFEKLTPFLSRMVFVHALAIPDFSYVTQGNGPLPDCRFRSSWAEAIGDWSTTAPGNHATPPAAASPCTFALRDLSFLVHPDIEAMGDEGHYRVKMPSFSYLAKYPVDPANYRPTEWRMGRFLALPLTHFEFREKANPSTEAKAQQAGFDTVVLDW